MKSQWFYIRRFKASRKNWHIARKHKKTGCIYLVEDASGRRFTSSYYDAYQLLMTITDASKSLYEYKIINASDLEHVDKFFKKVDYDMLK